jgi:Flp pilus assembly protein TadG
MRLTFRPTERRGAVTAEAAIVIPVFLLMVLGTIDLGLGVSRYSLLSQAARQGARQAQVHGQLAAAGWNGGRWGPATIDQPLTATGVSAVEAVRPTLATCPAADTRVKYEWLDGQLVNGVATGSASDEAGSRVRVTVTSTYQPITTYILGGATITLRASSTVLISH